MAIDGGSTLLLRIESLINNDFVCPLLCVYIYIHTYLQIAFFVSFACNVKVACLQSAKYFFFIGGSLFFSPLLVSLHYYSAFGKHTFFANSGN